MSESRTTNPFKEPIQNLKLPLCYQRCALSEITLFVWSFSVFTWFCWKNS